MNKIYQAPFIEIIKFESVIHLGASVIVEYPWAKDGESEYFE